MGNNELILMYLIIFLNMSVFCLMYYISLIDRHFKEE